MTKDNKSWEVRDLLDGRWGIFKNGLCIRVFNSHYEFQVYYKSRLASFGLAENPDRALDRAIRRMG